MTMRVPIMTDVTIRGIDDDVYSKFAAEAKQTGKAIGELTTEVMAAYVGRDKPAVYKIQNIDTLSVSRNDLNTMDGPVIFLNIDVLEFEDDVDWTSFKDHVERIENVDKIVLSKNLSKFQILSKAKNVEKIVVKG